MKQTPQQQALQQAIERVLSVQFPDVELVDLTVHGGRQSTLTLFIDHPSGVSLDLCTDVTRALDGFRDQYALEVSSPGLDRPLRRPEHFAQALGKTVAIKTDHPLGGCSHFRGCLERSDDEGITLHVDGGECITVPYGALAKAHVVYTDQTDGDRHE